MARSYKNEFQEWRNKNEMQGVRFYKNASDINVETSLKIGDKVIFTNDYGVVFGPYEVQAFSKPEHGRCVYIDYDCYWYPARPENLVLEEEYYNASLEQLTNVAEELDWRVVILDDCVELSKYTTKGQDFYFSLPKNSIHVNELYEYYDAYDPAEQSMAWIDPNGHGKNGAPDDIRDILDDMEEVKESLKTLYEALKNINKCGN